eukprot:gnl/MRDRNA2_/MRDRNA2_81095_c0_seq1.p1 gnl/MRDRNA2_/MRDRNA2_81095_c0~~gnl/MRDRNA2_/MRDRNA2_81095_c0_seq1.p1  ORF type:complete len:472 (-),score=59.22 gnl/MRDRNA2_/MRDRNA2_81095_c0_seq1:103-1518(-)
MSEKKTVSEVLSDLPLGRFHFLHSVRMLIGWVCFSAMVEITPYALPGLQKDFKVDDVTVGYFVSAFQVGGMIGTVLSVLLLDQIGRWRSIVCAGALAAVISMSMCIATSFSLLVALRVAQSTAYAFTMLAVMSWYPEFLPTKGRGFLMTALTAAWPCGRALVIAVASFFPTNNVPLFALPAVLFTTMTISFSFALESPRWLAATGDKDGSEAVLKSVYASNNAKWDANIQLTIDTADEDRLELSGIQSLLKRLGLVFGGQLRNRMFFAMSMYTLLSATTVLIDTWGLQIYARMLSSHPEASTDIPLPYYAMMIFNLGDLCGIIAATLLMDTIGRKGCFYIGFIVQGVFLAGLIFVQGIPTMILGFGFLNAACRAFAWDATHLWILEAFPTQVRGTAFALSNIILRVASILCLSITSGLVRFTPIPSMLKFTSSLLVIGGFVCSLAPIETARLDLHDSCRKANEDTSLLKMK